MLPTVSANPAVQSRYAELRDAGQSHNMAEILATRAFPGTRTDREFQMGRCNGNQFEGCPVRGDWYRRAAENAGVSTTGKFYHDGLAAFPGDPAAWVSGRGDVLRVAKERGLKLSGLVDYEPPGFHDYEPAPAVPIDPSLVEDEVSDILDSSPGLRRDEVYDRVYGLRSGAVELPDPSPVDPNTDDTPSAFR